MDFNKNIKCDGLNYDKSLMELSKFSTYDDYHRFHILMCYVCPIRVYLEDESLSEQEKLELIKETMNGLFFNSSFKEYFIRRDAMSGDSNMLNTNLYYHKLLNDSMNK